MQITKTDSPKSKPTTVSTAGMITTHAPAPLPGFFLQHAAITPNFHDRPFPSMNEEPPFSNYEGYQPPVVAPPSETWEKEYKEDDSEFPTGVKVELPGSPAVDDDGYKLGQSGSGFGTPKKKLLHKLFSSPGGASIESGSVGRNSGRSNRFGLGVGLGSGTPSEEGSQGLYVADNPAAWRGDVRAEFRSSPNPSGLGREVWSPSPAGSGVWGTGSADKRV